MKSSYFFTVLSILSLVALPNCTSNLKYRSRRLTPLNQSSAHSSRSKDGVTVSVKSFDDEEQTYYFGKETPYLHPLHLAIDNDSDTTWILSKENISLPLAENKDVAKQYKASPWTSVGLGALLLPVGLAHGAISHYANKIIETDIAEKSLEDEVIIDPDIQHNALVFCRSQAKMKRFTITLVDADDPSHTLQFPLAA